MMLVDVDLCRFVEVIDKGVENLGTETINSLTIDTINQHLKEPGVLDKLMFESDGYAGRPNYNKPREWFINLIAKSFTEEDLNTYREKLLTLITEEHETIVINALAEVFSKMLMSYDFQVSLANTMRQVEEIKEKLR